MRFVTRAVIGFIIFLLGVVGTGFALMGLAKSMNFDRPSFGGRDFERTWTVTTTPLAATTVTPVIESFGTVVAQNVAVVRPSVSGVLVERAPGVRDGALVQEGDTLFRLDPFPFETSVAEAKISLAETQTQQQRLSIEVQNVQAQVQAAKLSLEVATDALARQRSLRDQGVVADSAVESAQSALDATQSAFDTRTFALETAQNLLDVQALAIERAALSLARAEKSLDDSIMIAPVTGYISGLDAIVGANVNSSDVLLTITNPLEYQTSFQISDAQYARLLEDPRPLNARDLTVRWRVGDQTLTFPAVIDQVSTSVDQSNGGISVLARFKDLAIDTPLREGSFVSIVLPEAPLVDVFRLPAAAVSDAGGVFIIGDNRRLEEIQGTIKRRIDDDVIVDLPLEVGTEVIDNRYAQLSPGVLVEKFAPPDEAEEGNAASGTETAAAGDATQAEAGRGGRGQGGGQGNGGQGGGRGNGGQGGGGQAQGDLIDITPEQAQKAKELLENFPIPPERKAPIIEALDNNQIPARLAGRIGAQIGL